MRSASAARWNCEAEERPQLFALPFVFQLLCKDEQPEWRCYKDVTVVAGHGSQRRSRGVCVDLKWKHYNSCSAATELITIVTNIG